MALQDIQSDTCDDLDDAAAFEAALVEHMPLLRIHALSLSRRRELAEDLVQDVLAKAWGARRSFTPGSNLKAWLYVILRNELYSAHRRGWRQVPWEPALADSIAAPPAAQQWAAELSDTASAMRGLPSLQRDALILVGVGGFSHDEAAALTKIAVGTVKSRVGRARTALKQMLDGKTPLPGKSRPNEGNAMDEILGQLSAISTSCSATA